MRTARLLTLGVALIVAGLLSVAATLAWSNSVFATAATAMPARASVAPNKVLGSTIKNVPDSLAKAEAGVPVGSSGSTSPVISGPHSGAPNTGASSTPGTSKPGPGELNQTILWDAYNNDRNSAIISENRSDAPGNLSQVADNFDVWPSGIWHITEVDVRGFQFGSVLPSSFNVYFYLDDVYHQMPGTPVYTATNQTYSGTTDLAILLSTPVDLATANGSTQWVSVQANMTGDDWYWEGRSVSRYANYLAAFRNPGGVFRCPDWNYAANCVDSSWRSHMFRLIGTQTIFTPTPTSTSTFTSTPTVTPTCEPIQNGGFEGPQWAPWVIYETQPSPNHANGSSYTHSGSYSAVLGDASGTGIGEPLGNSSIYQQVTVPPGGGTLSYWWHGVTTDNLNYDWQDAYITDLNHNILAVVMHMCENMQPGQWNNQLFNMAPFAGQTVDVEFLVHEDGAGDWTYMLLDDVYVFTPCNSTPTYTITPTFTSTPANTPTNTPSTPDFTLSVNPTSQSVSRSQPGNPAVYSVTISPLHGFTGSVSLSVTGLPAGTRGTFSPNPVPGGSGTSVLTVNVGTLATLGTRTLRITGTNGGLSHSQNVTLTISP